MKKKFLSIIMLAFLFVIVGITSVNAATITARATSTVEENGKISVTITFPEPVSAVKLFLNYDSSKVTYSSSSGTSSPAVDQGGRVRVSHVDQNKSEISSVTLYFTAKAEGTANFSIAANPVLAKGDGTTLTNLSVGSSSTTITKKQEETPPPEEINPPTPPDDNPGGNTGNEGGNQGSNTGNQGSSSGNQGGNAGSQTKPTNTTPTEETPTFRSVNQTVYSKGSLNVRSSCSLSSSSNIIGHLSKGDEIKRTGTSSTWDRVVYNGKVAYIRTGYLSTTKPDEDEPAVEEPTTNENTVVENNIVENNVVDNENVVNNNEIDNEVENNIVNNNNDNKPEETKKKPKFIIYIIVIVIVVAVVTILIVYVHETKKDNALDDEDEDEDDDYDDDEDDE